MKADVQLHDKIKQIQSSGMKVAIMVGGKSYTPQELSLDQLSSTHYEIRFKPVNRADGIYRIIYLLEEL